ncbi:MAG: MFS transporter [Candidatus Roizmanbacteria bacterium]|nr:MAG: MFS transporter [Candidatus Roizmanbacteria bacterium]
MKTEEHIINESPEISIGENISLLKKIFKAFPAFNHHNYRLWFSGQLISVIGNWMQMIATGWLVLELTNSPFWVGAISALGSLPILIFSLFSGVISDRFPKRKVLFIELTGAMILAFLLGFLILTHTVNIYFVAIISLLLGILISIDNPVRQAFTVDIVGRESLSSAIALNSAMFNGARVLGPTIAGFLISAVGLAGAFIGNGISYIAVLAALFFMKVKSTVHPIQNHPITAIKEGISYAYSHKIISILLLHAGACSIFGWSYATILPVIVKNIFHLNAAGLGFFNAASGVGALVGVFIVTLFSKKVRPLVFILIGNILLVVSLILFSITTQVYPALFFLFLIGLGLILQMVIINTTIQHQVADHLRGRVLSLFSLMFLGMTPFGSFQIGYLAEHLGSPMSLRINAILILLFGLFLYFKRKELLKIPAN